MDQFLFLLVLAGGSQAFLSPADTKCDANQTTSPCSPVVGGSVYIKLVKNATGYRLHCYKDGLEIISLKMGKVKLVDAFKNRTEFTVSTGTLKIIHVERNDAGAYRVESYDHNGKKEKDILFTLQVKENIYLILIIVGIVVVIVVVILIVPLICCICRKSKGTQVKAVDVLYEKGFSPVQPDQSEEDEDQNIT